MEETLLPCTLHQRRDGRGVLAFTVLGASRVDVAAHPRVVPLVLVHG